MWSRGVVLWVTASVLTAGGCAPAKRLSAEEIMAALKAKGYDVVERNRLQPSMQGADYGFVFEVDGRPVSAWRFESPSRAVLGAGGNPGGFAVGCWAFAYADSATAARIRAALE